MYIKYIHTSAVLTELHLTGGGMLLVYAPCLYVIVDCPVMIACPSMYVVIHLLSVCSCICLRTRNCFLNILVAVYFRFCPGRGGVLLLSSCRGGGSYIGLVRPKPHPLRVCQGDHKTKLWFM